MPFIFVFNPTLILMGPVGEILLNVGTAFIGAVVLASGTMGQLIRKCNVVEIILLVAAGIALLLPGFQTDLPALIVVAGISAKQIWQRKKEITSPTI